MKANAIIGACALSLVLSSAAYAVNGKAQTQSGGMQGGAAAAGTTGATAGQNVVFRVNEQILNRDVRSQTGESLGTIREVIADANGRIQYVVIGTAGNKMTPIPWNALQSGPGNTYMVPLSRNDLARAPSFTGNAWPDLAALDWNTRIYNFYGLNYTPTKADFATLDANSDGMLTRDEVSANDRLNANFSKVDRNADGQISRAEFSAFEQTLPKPATGQAGAAKSGGAMGGSAGGAGQPGMTR